MSQDPFSDSAAIDVQDSESFECYNGLAPLKSNNNKTASRPENITVPILDTLPPLTSWNCSSDLPTLSSNSTVPTSPSTDTASDPIQWNTADLMYLLSILHPTLLLTNRLFFSPPLANLPSTPTPTHIHLYQKLPQTTSHAPLHLLLADSGRRATPALAQRALAHALLSNHPTLLHTARAAHTLLATLHSLPAATLRSVHAGMQLMVRVSEAEWHARWRQLRGGPRDGAVRGCGVDGTCGVEARMEVLMLEMGRVWVGAWVGRVGVVGGLGEGEKAAFKGVYEEAVGFLARAVEEMGGDG